VIIWAIAAVALSAVALVLAFLGLIQASKDYDKPDDVAVVSRRFDGVDPETATVTYPVPLDQDLQDYIVETAKSYGVAPSIVFAIIGVETGGTFDPNSMGDYQDDGFPRSFGLMQIWEEHHHERCARLNAYNLLDPYQNVRVGIDFLAELLDSGHTIDECLTYYNTGYWQEPNEYARTVLCNAEQILEGVMVQ